jgi:hypothetical protein
LERLVDIPALAIICTSSASAISMTARAVLKFLDRRGDRRFARHVFDQTRSTDALHGYSELRGSGQPVISLRSKPPGGKPSARPPQLPP